MGRRIVVSVIGAGREEDPEVLSLARELGREIKTAGWDLACGGLGGVMEAACRGFQEAAGQGIAIGILPGQGAAEGNLFLDLVLPTGMGPARNSLVVQAGDAVVAVGGGSGTLAEIALAWQYGRHVIALVGAGGFGAELAGRTLDRTRGDEIRPAASVAEAIAILHRVLY